MRRFAPLAVAVALAGSLSACALPMPPTNLVSVDHTAAAALAEQAAPNAPNGPVLVTSLADVSDLTVSSPFGRIVSDQLATTLVAKGFRVVESRLSNALTISPSGEFMLSREAKDIASQQNAALVLVGTYTRGHALAYVTARLVRVADGRIMASHDWSVPIDAVEDLLPRGTAVKARGNAETGFR